MATVKNNLLFEITLTIILAFSGRTSDDLKVIITEDALNDKILYEYRPLFHRAILLSSFEGDIKDGDCFDIPIGDNYCQWDDVHINYFNYSDISVVLSPSEQQLQITLTDFSIHSKYFDFQITELVDCKGQAMLNINNWDFSCNVNILQTEYCEYQLEVDESSIIITGIDDTDELPVSYNLSADSALQWACDELADEDNDQIQELFQDLINDYITDTLPGVIQKNFQSGLDEFLTEEQHFDLSTDFGTIRIYLCFENLTINANHDLVGVAAFEPNNTTNDTYGYSNVGEDFVIERIDHSVNVGHVVLYVIVGLLLLIFACVGCYECCVGIGRRCCKRKQDRIKEEISLDHSTRYHRMEDNEESKDKSNKFDNIELMSSMMSGQAHN